MDHEGGWTFEPWAVGLTLAPAADVLGPLAQVAVSISERLGKAVQFELSGADVMVEADRMRAVLAAATHCVRSAVDHGVEPPGERGCKPACATVRLAIEDIGAAWQVRIADDGRGLDVARLAERAVAQGLLTVAGAASMTRTEQLRLLFVAGSSNITSAVRAVEAHGGHIDVVSSPGRGTTIVWTVPKPEGFVIAGACSGSVQVRSPEVGSQYVR